MSAPVCVTCGGDCYGPVVNVEAWKPETGWYPLHSIYRKPRAPFHLVRMEPPQRTTEPCGYCSVEISDAEDAAVLHLTREGSPWVALHPACSLLMLVAETQRAEREHRRALTASMPDYIEGTYRHQLYPPDEVGLVITIDPETNTASFASADQSTKSHIKAKQAMRDAKRINKELDAKQKRESAA